MENKKRLQAHDQTAKLIAAIILGCGLLIASTFASLYWQLLNKAKEYDAN